MGADETATIERRPAQPPATADDADRTDRTAGTARAAAEPPTVHRLRDLDRRGRVVAALFALALALAPLLAFAQTAPDWEAAGDPALMALRALDVGTSRTPVSGQPSTSAYYVDDVSVVTHPGPIHFYLMALPVRLLGAAPGMLVVSLLITGGCVLLAAWAAFRQLGPPGGVVAAMVLGGITFTTGASSLMNPVSSNIAGYPLLCSTVLLWCLLCGDYRLLPLTALVVSFAGQQHLSSVPTLAIAVVAVGLVLMLRIRRHWRDPIVRRRLTPWVLGSAAISVVLWMPVLLQQLLGEQGNLSTLVEFTRHDDRPTVGFDSALYQMAHVLGSPPLLGKPQLTGQWLLAQPSVLRWASAAVVLGLAVLIGVRARRTQPRRAALLTMTIVLLVAGMFNGSSVPSGIEEQRLPFYHWTWPLTFFVVVGLALAVVWWVGARAADRSRLADRGWLTPAALTLSVLVIAVPSLVNPSLERRSNTLSMAGSILERSKFEALGDGIMEHRDQLGEQTVLVERGRILFEGFGPALTIELLERGLDVRLVDYFGLTQAVHADRMVDLETLASGLVLVVGDGIHPYGAPIPGELVAEVNTSGFDTEGYLELVAQSRAVDEVVLDPELVRLVESAEARAFAQGLADEMRRLPSNGRELLREPQMLQLLLDYPLIQPRLDPDVINRVLASLSGEQGYELQVYLLDRDEVLDFARPFEIGGQG